VNPPEKGLCNEPGAGQASSKGLYDPAFEHDSCGVGFVARLDARPDHGVIRDAVEILVNLEHRGAIGGDKATGDGAGLLVQIPDDLFQEACPGSGFNLPEGGGYGVGMIFLPRDDALTRQAVRAFERVCEQEGCPVLGWRKVPVDADTLGEFAKAGQPEIRQVFLCRERLDPEAFERKLYVIRRLAEKTLAGGGHDPSPFYVVSLSGRTLTYKGMLVGTQLADFYPDLRDERFQSAFAVVHQRYSTNTFPSWSLAQPFRFLAHNGEINTLRGNVNRMRAREAILESGLFGPDIEKIKPVIDEGGSDSAMLDNALELLVLGGRSLPHAMMMLVPEAWGSMYLMGQDQRAFYEYHAAFMEPWDGPAALAFTDGRYVGASLDRNGLRPARYTVTRDGRVILASETGVLDVPADRILSRGRLRPGRMLLVDLQQKRLIPDNQIKATISRQQPYRHWVMENRIGLRGLLMPSHPPSEDPEVLVQKQHAFGYTEEQLDMILTPMASRGQEAVGSMGNDAALAVLSDRPQLLFDYFKQLFAQVTNPAIDPLREELVMSLMGFAGRQRNLLAETPEHCRQLKLHHPILTPEDMHRLRYANHSDIVTADIDILFPSGGDGSALEAALTAVFAQAEKAIAGGATLLILSDRRVNGDRTPIPVLLATSGLHHHLMRRGLRTCAGIILETGEPREVMHFALLMAYGANAVCPYLALATVRHLSEEGLLETSPTPEEALDSYITAVKKGLLKTLSRMGISTIRSFHGAQIFEAVGLGSDLIEKYFTGTASRVGGIGLDEIAEEAGKRHRQAFPLHGSPSRILDQGGAYNNRVGGERHLLSAEAIYKLQQACWTNDYKVFKEYSRIIDEQSSVGVTLRSLLRFRKGDPIPLEEVEPVETVVSRFTTGAMSLGSISRETHETIAVAMNRLGARSNSGEGGEDPRRYSPLPGGDSSLSRTKQVASGRFGVTIEYLVNADELQIKIAQGAKPGEGGQLPGHKVSEEIGRVRHTTPGVTLISPPPHHDIYSIEDIAQLIFDLKMANPKARVSVKLVSEAGVGTIAAGVAKAKADMVLIAGHDGGTGASPLTAIKRTGLPWELGLAETQQTLVRNRLRDRIRVQVDGQLRTGRDLAIASLLGAEEFGFGTITLVTLGCVMMRKCHLNTCPVGIATQDEALRSRFPGKPEHVERFMRFIAHEFREWMAELGFRTVDEMVGRVDRLETPPATDRKKAGRLDLRGIIAPPDEDAASGTPVRCVRSQEHEIHEALDNEILQRIGSALDTKRPVRLEMPIRNVHRSIGATLSGEIARRYGLEGLPTDTITLSLTGSAGQSLGAFLAAGVTLRVEGDANDYAGKGLSGGKIILVPPGAAAFDPSSNVIAGNVALYGAVRGEAYVYGLAGERFAIRNSGARAVVEGIGDHGCEYMTGGVVVVLGTTGYNFAAGMTGGIAYVYNESGAFDTRCNLDTVDLESVWTEEDQQELKILLEAHVHCTASLRARKILDNWEACLPSFVKVMPIDYKQSLERMRLQEDRDDETVSATEEVYHG
jgi:glutamate synthase domain-containing protein 2/glutamate synthase domain-containing protein 1/glutamate synthase domain-containing protein 3